MSRTKGASQAPSRRTPNASARVITLPVVLGPGEVRAGRNGKESAAVSASAEATAALRMTGGTKRRSAFLRLCNAGRAGTLPGTSRELNFRCAQPQRAYRAGRRVSPRQSARRGHAHHR